MTANARTSDAISINSPLGQWTHHEHRVHALSDVLDHLWHFDGRMALPRERTFPGGYLEIILHLGPQFRDVHADGTSGAPFPVACLTGSQTRPVVIESPNAHCCVLGIRLTPIGAYRVLGTPLTETADCTIDLRDVTDAASAQLASRCFDAHTVADRFAIVVAWIEERLARNAAAHAGIAHAARTLAAQHGQTRISTLQDAAGLSRARFVALFREQTGYAPKQLARILRFRRALNALQHGERLSDAAFTAGYFDQSHMHADFSEFAGLTPAGFVSAQRYPNSPSVPESA